MCPKIHTCHIWARLCIGVQVCVHIDNWPACLSTVASGHLDMDARCISGSGQWTPWCRHRQSNKRSLSASQSAVRSALGRGLWCLASMKHTASTTFDSNVPNSKRKKHIGQTNIKNTENRSVASKNSRELRLYADQIRWALPPPDIIIFLFGSFFLPNNMAWNLTNLFNFHFLVQDFLIQC